MFSTTHKINTMNETDATQASEPGEVEGLMAVLLWLLLAEMAAQLY
jgi:hypothetical protein